MKLKKPNLRVLLLTSDPRSYSVAAVVLLILLTLVSSVFAGVDEGDTPLVRKSNQRAAIGSHNVSAQGREIADWLAERDFESLTITELQWCLQKLLSDDTPVEKLQVSWTGLLQAPRSGSYEFSVSPINANHAGLFSAEHRMVVTVGGQPALDTSPATTDDSDKPQRPSSRAASKEAWQWKGKSMELQANVPVPIKVTMTYSSPPHDPGEKEQVKISSPAALLFWEGPAIERQVVADNFLTDSDGQPGLKAEYRWPSKIGKRVVLQKDGNVDFAWSSLSRALPNNRSLVNRLTARLFELATSSKYIQACTSGETQHVYFADSSCTDYLSTGQRQQFLQLLLGSSELLESIKKEQLSDVYRRFRFGAEEKALEFLGHWLSLRPDITPEISNDFFRDNRQIYWELAQLLAQQQPERVEDLKDNYLVAEDGRCVLPVAYALTHSYRSQPIVFPTSSDSKVPEPPMLKWAGFLDEMLDDKSVTGNMRVNWLIAKAQSMESRAPLRPGLKIPRKDYLAGRDWLTEAELVADDKAKRIQIFAEKVARLAAHNREHKVQELLQSAEGTVPPPQLQAWRKATEAIARTRREQRLAATQRARSAYIQVIQRRRERAAQLGNEQSVGRYDQILQQAAASTN